MPGTQPVCSACLLNLNLHSDDALELMSDPRPLQGASTGRLFPSTRPPGPGDTLHLQAQDPDAVITARVGGGKMAPHSEKGP